MRCSSGERPPHILTEEESRRTKPPGAEKARPCPHMLQLFPQHASKVFEQQHHLGTMSSNLRCWLMKL